MKDLEELQAKHHQVLQEKVQLESQVTGSGRNKRSSRKRRRGKQLAFERFEQGSKRCVLLSCPAMLC